MFTRQTLHRQAAHCLRWWREGLELLLPESFRSRLRRSTPEVWLTCEQEHLHCRTAADHTVTGEHTFNWTDSASCAGHLHEWRSTGHEIILLLPPAQTLHKNLSFPAAALEDLRQVLEFEMDRRTPFSAEQVYFDYRLMPARNTPQTIEIELALIPRANLDRTLEHLAGLSIRPDRIDTATTDDRPAGFDLLRNRNDTNDDTGHQHNERALWVLAVVLLLAYIGLPIIKQQQYIAELERQVASERNVITRLEGLEQQRDQLVEQVALFRNRHENALTPIEIVDELTQRLPDDTWLQRFTLTGDTLHLIGESSSASALIGLMQSSSHFTNAQFRSPVTHNDLTQQEKFHLSVQLTDAGENDET